MDTEKRNDENWLFPPGIVLRLHKYIDGTSPRRSSNEAEKSELERPYFAFGNFDFLNFLPVEKFADYYSKSSYVMWRGHRQDVMLYALPSEDDNRHFGFESHAEKSKQQFRMIQNGEAIDKRFLVVSMLYVSGVAKDYFYDYQHFLDYCKRAILNIAKVCNDKLDENAVVCEVFGTFNSSEVAILWGTDYFTDIQFIVDHIRYLTFQFQINGKLISTPAFISTYSIIACGNSDKVFQSGSDNNRALIQLVSCTGRNSDVDLESSLDFLDNWRKSENGERKIFCCAGEYDFVYSGGSSTLEKIYKAYGNSLDDADDLEKDFWKYFSRGATRIVYCKDDISDELQKLDWKVLLHVSVQETDCAKDIPTVGEMTSCKEKACQTLGELEKEIDLFLKK